MKHWFPVILFLTLSLAVPAWAAPTGQIVVAQGVDPTTLDPQNHEETPAYNVLLNLYDTLLFRDKDLKIIPWLAESWKVVNPTLWEFKIRKGVKFHNGEEVDADVVKFSLDRLMDPNQKLKQAGNFKLVEKVEVVDKYTVRIYTKKPFPTLENQLALRGAIVPPKYFKENDMAYLSKNPVGSGPFKFVKWMKDEQIVLEANESYWGGAPKFKTLVFRPIPETQTRVAAVQSGEADVVTNVPPHLIKQIMENPKLTISKAPSVRTIFIPIYTHKFDRENKVAGPLDLPTKDKRVRQAILAAVDVDAIIKNVLEGQAIRTATPLTSKHFGFDPELKPIKQDVEKAKRLLAAAGYPNGIDLQLNSPDGRYLRDKEVAEAVAGQLTKAGIRTKVRVYEWGTYMNQIAYIHGGAPFWLIGWGNTTWDADGTLVPMFRSGGPLANFYNPEYDKLMDEAATSVDPKQRLALYAKAQRILLDDGGVIPLYQQMDLYGVNKRVNYEALSSEQIVGLWMSIK